MDKQTVKDQLNQLEKAIRHLAKDSKWLLLEPLNPQLMEELRAVRDILATASEKTDSPAINEKPAPATPPPVPAPEEDRYVPPETPSSSSHKPMDLDPLQAGNLDSLKIRLRDCNRCPLCQGRSTIVFGQGNQQSEIVFVGEGPGAEEDRTGQAFVGKAGKLLTQMIHSIGLNREAVYICNIVKCRPPGNRNPTGEEITACLPFLKKQLEILQPKLIVTMGNVATQTLLPGASGIMKMRGTITAYEGITLLPTFHPSYLLRNTSALIDVWTDMRKIRQLLFQKRKGE